MFREMRRSKQQLPAAACAEILRTETCGVLAVSGDDGYPYAVPLSFVYDGEKLYFHSAKSGHKLDALRHSDKASFCVIAQDTIVPEKFTTYFRSVIAFGRVRELTDEDARHDALLSIARKYSTGDEAACREETEKSLAHACLLEMTIDHLSGKQAIELVPKKAPDKD